MTSPHNTPQPRLTRQQEILNSCALLDPTDFSVGSEQRIPRQRCWGCEEPIAPSQSELKFYRAKTKAHHEAGLCHSCFNRVLGHMSAKYATEILRETRIMLQGWKPAIVEDFFPDPATAPCAHITGADSIFYPSPFTSNIMRPWTLTRTKRTALATRHCVQCPLWEDCLNAAMTVEWTAPIPRRHGIWGGQTPDLRTALSAHFAAVVDPENTWEDPGLPPEADPDRVVPTDNADFEKLKNKELVADKEPTKYTGPKGTLPMPLPGGAKRHSREKFYKWLPNAHYFEDRPAPPKNVSPDAQEPPAALEDIITDLDDADILTGGEME